MLRQNHELAYRALISLRLYYSVAKQIKQQTACRWFAGSKPERDFKSPVNWNPLQVEFTEQLLIYFYVLNRVKKSICFFIAKLNSPVM